MIEIIYLVIYGVVFENFRLSYESKRIYELEEIEIIFNKMNMKILCVFGEFEEDFVLLDDYNYFFILFIKF